MAGFSFRNALFLFALFLPGTKASSQVVYKCLNPSLDIFSGALFGPMKALIDLEKLGFEAHVNSLKNMGALHSDTAAQCKIKKGSKVDLSKIPDSMIPAAIQKFKNNPMMLAGAYHLLDVNSWGDFTNTTFDLYDDYGKRAMRSAKVGDFIRITLPGPDSLKVPVWVQIKNVVVKDGKNPSFSIEVKPTYDPRPVNEFGRKRKIETKVVDHFFDSETSNLFVVRQTGDRMTTEVHGRNEKINFHQTRNGIEQRRNVATAVAGVGLIDDQNRAVFGPQKMTWQDFTQNMLNHYCPGATPFY